MEPSQDFTNIVPVCRNNLFEMNKCWPKGETHEKMTESVEIYLKRFWRSIGPITYNNRVMFDNHIFNISYIVSSSKPCCLGDFVVVKPEEDYQNNDWTWKCKISKKFTHECNGSIDVFFQREYLWQITHG